MSLCNNQLYQHYLSHGNCTIHTSLTSMLLVLSVIQLQLSHIIPVIRLMFTEGTILYVLLLRCFSGQLRVVLIFICISTFLICTTRYLVIHFLLSIAPRPWRTLFLLLYILELCVFNGFLLTHTLFTIQATQAPSQTCISLSEG